jgi:UDP-N-acetyl-D-mannosaminuronic acid dehydrogenase
MQRIEREWIMDLIRRIEEKSAGIAVVGMGYVGLPTAAVLAANGFRVVGADINPSVVACVNRGTSPINEPGLEELVREAVANGKLKAVLSAREAARESDVVIVVVQTPIDEEKRPDLSALKSALRDVAVALRKGHLVIIESTIPPGTTRNVIAPILEESGLKAGEDFFLAYSPERAIPTRTLAEIQSNARIVGGVNRASSQVAAALYRQITSGDVYEESVEVVEVVKLIENTFRDVNIALANELALLCETIGVDVIKAINLANKHPRVNLHMPGAGVGGHCLPKDPYFLINEAERHGLKLKVIEAARERNDSMPLHVLSKIEEALKSKGKSVSQAKVAVLGIAYKGNTDDVRLSPAEPVIKSLMNRGVDVISHDPYAKHDFGGRFSNDLKEVVAGADVVVILTDHDEYKKLRLEEIKPLLKRDAVVIDGRRVLSRENVEKVGLRYTGIGC